MAQIFQFPQLSLAVPKEVTGEVGIANAIARISAELVALQDKVAAADLAEMDKVSTAQALLSAVVALHGAVGTIGASLAGKLA